LPVHCNVWYRQIMYIFLITSYTNVHISYSKFMKQRNAMNNTLTHNRVNSYLHEVKHISLRKGTCKRFLTTECKYIFINWRIIARGSVRSTRGLGPTMTAWGQSIGILIGMLPQTLITSMSKLDQLLRLGARI
jgi:hypothetical protein